MRYKLFFKNAVILTVTSLILRTAGIFFRIWLSNAVGSEGMGIYQVILSVYVFASTFATTGICTAVTRIVSELPAVGATAKKTVTVCALISVALAVATSAVLFAFAKEISVYFIGDIRAEYAVKILGLGLPFMGVASVIRGYFLAIRNTSYSSGAQLLEQAVRIAVIMLLVSRFGGYGLKITCTAIVFGDGVAEAIGCIALYIRYRLSIKESKNNIDNYPVMRKIAKIALPITAGRYIHTALRTAENLLVPTLLGKFCNDKSRGLSQFGMLKGMAMPLLFFPASFLSAFSMLMIPEISGAMAQNRMGKVQKTTEKSISITVVASVIIGAIFAVLGKETALLFYESGETGILICALSPLVPLMYLESVCDGILKGLDQQTHSFLYGVADSVSRIVLILIFTEKYGMVSFLLVMVYSNILTSLLNIRRLLKVTKTKMDFKNWIIYPLFSAVVAGTVGYFVKINITAPILKIALCGGVMCVIYVVLMYFFGVLRVIEDTF